MPRPNAKRALSMPRAPGRIVADGPRDLTDGLVAALRAPATDHDVGASLTHPFHSYPARLHPATARILVEIVVGTRRARGPILDPFCGSGTVLVEACAGRVPSVGADLNPLAVLVARAKTWTVSGRRRKELRDAAHTIAGSVLAAGKAARRAGAEPMPRRRPTGFDPNARDRRLASWFAPHVRRELEALAAQIDDLGVHDAELGEVLLACLSAILYKVSSRTSDTDGTWVDRNIARGAPCRLFGQRAELLVAGLADMGSAPPPSVFELDARRLYEVVPDGSAGGAVTSPPYAGTYDYAEHQRLRFDFLGLRHRAFDEGEIGARRSFEHARDGDNPMAAWRTALADSLATLARALGPGALAAVVIGDSLAGGPGRGRAMYALDDVRAALTDELGVAAWASQHRPMLGAAERRAFGDRPKAEHIILLQRR